MANIRDWRCSASGRHPATAKCMGSAISISVIPGRDRLSLNFPDAAMQRYRVRDGKVEFQTGTLSEWHALTAEEVVQHLMLDTPLATWLQERVGWRVKLPGAA